MISDSERVACQINYTVSEQKKISINDFLLHDTFFFFLESPWIKTCDGTPHYRTTFWQFFFFDTDIDT